MHDPTNKVHFIVPECYHCNDCCLKEGLILETDILTHTIVMSHVTATTVEEVDVTPGQGRLHLDDIIAVVSSALNCACQL